MLQSFNLVVVLRMGMVDVTLKDGIEKTLMEQIPEVTGVKDLTDHSIDDNAYYK